MSCGPQAWTVVQQGLLRRSVSVGVEEADAPQALGPGHAEVGHLALMHARPAKALHAQEDAFQPAGFVRVGAAEGRAAEVVDDRGGVLGELPGQRLDGPLGHAALLRGPLGGLRYAVLVLAQHVVGHLVHAHGVGRDVVLVPGALGQPHIDDGQLQGGVGVGKHGDPLVGVDGGGVVEVGADVHLLDARSRPELADAAGVLPGEAPGGGLFVAAPLEHHVAVLGDVLDEVGRRRHHALEALAPHVLGSPVPAFPTVRVADLLGEATHHVEQPGLVAVGGVDGLVLAVAVALGEDGERAVFLVDAPDLGGDDVGRLVPGDAPVLALAAVLGVALAVGVPVDADHGELHPVGRKGPLLVGEGERRGKGFRQRASASRRCAR